MDGVPDLPDQRPVRPQDMRAADAERERVLDRLRQAHVEGRLDIEELDEWITAGLAARTDGQPAAVTEDLPATPTPVTPGTELEKPDESGSGEFRLVAWAWVGVNVMTLSIWVLSCIAAGVLIYPWFLWVAGPWGLLLLVIWLRRRLRR